MVEVPEDFDDEVVLRRNRSVYPLCPCPSRRMMLLAEDNNGNPHPSIRAAPQVQRWRASGQTQRVFANAVGVNPNTFASWARRFPKRPAEGSPAFLKVVAEPVEEAAPPFVCAVEVDGRRRWTLTLGAPPAPEWLGAVLSAVTAC